MNFGKTICELRKKKNATQEDMAAQLGVTAAAVSKWENNCTLPDILMLAAIADYFDVTTDELLGRNARRKYAVITAESPELARQIEALAKQHSLTTVEICNSYQTALDAAALHGHVRYILVSCGQALTKAQWDATPDNLYVLDSPNETTDRILAGFELFFGQLGI